MTDLEMTRLCAQAMGWTHLGNVGIEPPKPGEPDPKGLWCLSGGNDWWLNPEGHSVCAPCSGIPDPLTNDADAMALVKRFKFPIRYEYEKWEVANQWGEHQDLNRAIVEAVAKMRSAKRTARNQ